MTFVFCGGVAYDGFAVQHGMRCPANGAAKRLIRKATGEIHWRNPLAFHFLRVAVSPVSLARTAHKLLRDWCTLSADEELWILGALAFEPIFWRPLIRHRNGRPIEQRPVKPELPHRFDQLVKIHGLYHVALCPKTMALCNVRAVI